MTIPDRFEGRLYLSTEEVASLTPLRAWQIAEKCKRRELRAIKEGKVWMVEAESAWEWLGVEGHRWRDPEPELPTAVKKLLAKASLA